ncbi:MAG: serine/threonine-protein kinase [Actinomycetota bacterium]
MPPEDDILPPRYKHPRRIGYGGMGEIFRAEDEVLGRTVAIKVLAERYSRDESVRARFTREALAAARLSAEPSTVTIFDVGEWNDRPFIVMEYLDGGSLEDRLKAGKPPTDQALDWLEQAGVALDAAHRHGVVHRDVKPGNLLIDEGGALRVADFGIASAAGMDSLTAAGTVLGTAGYLAPEQARGERATTASDRYALGVVAFELLTGQRPFEAESATAEATAHVHAEIPSVSEQLDPVFQKALAKEPGARFETAGALALALRDALDPGARSTRVLPTVRRSPIPIAVSVLAAFVLAGAGLAALLLHDGHKAAGGGISTPKHPTVAQPPPPPPPPPPPADGTALTDQATRLLQNGNYPAAERIARQAVAALQGSGQVYEGSAEYDLGLALAQLGRCDEALVHLDRSVAIQGRRHEIDRVRKLCKGKKGGGGGNEG